MKKDSFLREMLSEQGLHGSYISSKRVVGFMLALVSMACTIYLTIRDGGTVVVENLIQTSLVMSASLLGISSVTSIWKNGSMSIGEQKEPKEEPKMHPHRPRPICPYIEKGTD